MLPFVMSTLLVGIALVAVECMQTCLRMQLGKTVALSSCISTA